MGTSLRTPTATPGRCGGSTMRPASRTFSVRTGTPSPLAIPAALRQRFVRPDGHPVPAQRRRAFGFARAARRSEGCLATCARGRGRSRRRRFIRRIEEARDISRCSGGATVFSVPASAGKQARAGRILVGAAIDPVTGSETSEELPDLPRDRRTPGRGERHRSVVASRGGSARLSQALCVPSSS